MTVNTYNIKNVCITNNILLGKIYQDFFFNIKFMEKF